MRELFSNGRVEWGCGLGTARAASLAFVLRKLKMRIPTLCGALQSRWSRQADSLLG
jgi:hypothetical protein